MSAAYTPGPWSFEPRDKMDAGDVQRPWVGNLKTNDYAALACGPTTDVAFANAALISAAPDLVEACQRLIPSGVCLTNKNIPDDFTVALDCTMGDLRFVAAALRKAMGDAQ